MNRAATDRIALKLWIWISAAASFAGWILSLVHQLDLPGYLVAAAITIALWFLLKAVEDHWTPQPREMPTRSPMARCRCGLSRLLYCPRFRRPLPLLFFTLAVLVFVSGVLYAPNNHMGLTYRVPRVLHYLADHHWSWVHTPDPRINDRACDNEWLIAPLLLFTHSDRALFLLNFFPFLLLPGLVFSVWTRLGVRARVAWHWMWLLPTGYTFLLQAGSTANDTFPTVYALAALDFSCRAWASRRWTDLWYSFLAAGLLTGAKASNLPLLLPWVISLVPLLRNGFSPPHPLSRRVSLACTAVVLVLAAMVSFLPTALLNIRYCGDWSGLALERPGMDMKNPLVGIWGNALVFLLDNLVPPFFPAASWWNQNALSVLPHALIEPLVENFEASFHWLWELPTEDWVGIGFGLSWLIIISILAAARRKRKSDSHWARREALPYRVRTLVLWGAWVALLAYCVKSGMATGARLISPYYPLLLPMVLASSSQQELVRRKWWQIAAWITVFLAVPVLVVTPGRPLWPARTILSRFHSSHPDQRLITRALNVYSIYASRADSLASARSLLPPGLAVVGFMARGDDSDISLWRPFFQRQVAHVLVSDSAQAIHERKVEYIIAGDINFGLNATTFEAWRQNIGAELVAVTNATARVSEGSQPWYLVRIRPTVER